MNFFKKPSEAFQSQPTMPETDDVIDVTPMSFPDNGGVPSAGDRLALKVMKPDGFGEVGDVATHLLNRTTVVLNAENLGSDVLRRMLDFLSGVSYAIGGNVTKISATTYILTPQNVNVSDAGMAAAMGAGSFGG